jgi:hypothetical protein
VVKALRADADVAIKDCQTNSGLKRVSARSSLPGICPFGECGPVAGIFNSNDTFNLSDLPSRRKTKSAIKYRA